MGVSRDDLTIFDVLADGSRGAFLTFPASVKEGLARDSWAVSSVERLDRANLSVSDLVAKLLVYRPALASRINDGAKVMNAWSDMLDQERADAKAADAAAGVVDKDLATRDSKSWLGRLFTLFQAGLPSSPTPVQAMVLDRYLADITIGAIEGSRSGATQTATSDAIDLLQVVCTALNIPFTKAQLNAAANELPTVPDQPTGTLSAADLAAGSPAQSSTGALN
jgi:hypothetical protein